jgi:hypothetical protein
MDYSPSIRGFPCQAYVRSWHLAEIAGTILLLRLTDSYFSKAVVPFALGRPIRLVLLTVFTNKK